MARLVVIVVALLLVVWFAVQNASGVTVTMLFWEKNVSLALLLCITFLIGLVTGIIMNSYRNRAKKKTLSKNTIETKKPE